MTLANYFENPCETILTKFWGVFSRGFELGKCIFTGCSVKTFLEVVSLVLT